MSGCLRESVAALVDGELDHAARERAQAHLLHCASCRGEVEAHRRLKARLSGLPAPPPSDAVTARLLALPAPQPALPVLRPHDPTRPHAPHARRPARTRSHRRALALAGAGGAVVAAALVLGGAPTSATTPVDPGTDVFVVQHVGTTGEVPRTTRAGVGSR